MRDFADATRTPRAFLEDLERGPGIAICDRRAGASPP